MTNAQPGRTGKNTLIIRADANKRMGTGHIMRCIALAQEWVAQNGTVLFICCLSNAALLQRLQSLNFETRLIEKSCPDPLDIDTTLSMAAQRDARVMVVDGYQFTCDYHKKIREHGIKLMVIDDYNHLPFYHADILLNQNTGAQAIPYHTPPGTIPLLGSDFALLRDEFLTAARPDAPKTDQVSNILVTMGGSDPDNVTLKTIKALNRLAASSLKVKIALGPGNQNHESVIKEARASVHDMEVIDNASNMPELMSWAEMAISAGGSTALELLYLNVPALFFIIADNQKRIVEQIEAANAGINGGRPESLSMEAAAQKIDSLLNNKELRKKIRYNAGRLIDGKGRQKTILSLMHGTRMAHLKINIVSDHDSWITPFVQQLEHDLKAGGHRVNTGHLVPDLKKGDVAFFLGCGQMVSNDLLALNTHNLVVHESNLPSGRGWSPLTWQILEGKNHIPITLFEARPQVDSGPVYLQKQMQFKGDELLEELREKQGQYSVGLCLEFINTYPEVISKAKEQKGSPSYYSRRSPEDSRLDVDKTIKEQFNLMRVADNTAYPLFFEMNGHKYTLNIKKDRTE